MPNDSMRACALLERALSARLELSKKTSADWAARYLLRNTLRSKSVHAYTKARTKMMVAPDAVPHAKESKSPSTLETAAMETESR